MKGKESLWENENWTQNEVAKYFRVVPGTVKNWREQGLLKYWQAPGSSRVLFSSEDVRDFINKHKKMKGGDKLTGLNRIQRGKPVVSSIGEDWRI
jgi:DNA-binding transcriptional MerR regulator